MELTLRPLHEEAIENNTSKFIGLVIETVGLVHASHLMTRSYARHKALDEYYKDMPELIDVFAESSMGGQDLIIKPSVDFEYSTIEELLIYTRDSGILLHKEISDKPQLTNPLEDVLTLISQTLYKLKFQ